MQNDDLRQYIKFLNDSLDISGRNSEAWVKRSSSEDSSGLEAFVFDNTDLGFCIEVIDTDEGLVLGRELKSDFGGNKALHELKNKILTIKDKDAMLSKREIDEMMRAQYYLIKDMQNSTKEEINQKNVIESQAEAPVNIKDNIDDIFERLQKIDKIREEQNLSEKKTNKRDI